MDADTKRDYLISVLAEYPDYVVAAACVYAQILNDYGVETRKPWENITQMQADLQRAYIQGRHDESERRRKTTKTEEWE